METLSYKEITVPLRDVPAIECLIQAYGIKGATFIHEDVFARIRFSDDSDYLIFLLRDVLGKSREIRIYPDFDFMVRLEKKLRIYKKEDEYFIRKAFRKE
jgi:hypothetical protein